MATLRERGKEGAWELRWMYAENAESAGVEQVIEGSGGGEQG